MADQSELLVRHVVSIVVCEPLAELRLLPTQPGDMRHRAECRVEQVQERLVVALELRELGVGARQQAANRREHHLLFQIEVRAERVTHARQPATSLRRRALRERVEDLTVHVPQLLVLLLMDM